MLNTSEEVLFIAYNHFNIKDYFLYENVVYLGSTK